MAEACPKEQLSKLLDAGLAGAGIAALAAAWPPPATPPAMPLRVHDLKTRLAPHLTLGHADEQTSIDPLIALALCDPGQGAQLSPGTGPTRTVVVGQAGGQHRARDQQHGGHRRGRQGQEPAHPRHPAPLRGPRRRNSWSWATRSRTLPRPGRGARPHLAGPYPALLRLRRRTYPSVPEEGELKKRAAVAWLRLLGTALAVNPPETVDVDDDRGLRRVWPCAQLERGRSERRGRRDRATRIGSRACEKLLGETAGRGNSGSVKDVKEMKGEHRDDDPQDDWRLQGQDWLREELLRLREPTWRRARGREHVSLLRVLLDAVPHQRAGGAPPPKASSTPRPALDLREPATRTSS